MTRTTETGQVKDILMKFRVTEAEAGEIVDALRRRKVTLSGLARRLLLAWARDPTAR